MKPTRTAILKTLRFLTLASLCLAAPAFADEYSEVSQLLKANKFPEAMTRVDSALKTKPADPQLRFLKGVILRNQGKQAEAITIFTRLTEDYPELPEPYNNLAVLYAGQGQYDKARAALEMAIRTNPSYATAHENIGDVYARLASQAYNKALQLDNNNAAVPPKLALIKEVFKPNLNNPKPGATPPAATVPVAPPAPVPVVKPVAPAPVVTAPTVKPATPVAPPTAKPAPAVNNDAKEVESSVMNWAKAWSAKNMNGYLKAYSPKFDTPNNQSRSAWEKERRARIMEKSRISVQITDLTITVNGDKAVAKFRQGYKADSLSVSSRKTLNLQKVGNQWQITRESTGG